MLQTIFKVLGKCDFFLFLKKCVKISRISNFKCLVFFQSPGLVHKHMQFDLIKMHPKIFFSQKTLIFTFLYPKMLNKWKLSWNTSKLWPIEMLMIRSKFIQYYWCLSQKKNEFVKCSFISMISLFNFVCFVALRPKSTAKVMAGRSFHLTTLFPWQAWTSK